MTVIYQELQELLKNHSIEIYNTSIFQKFNFYFITPQQNDFSNITFTKGIFEIIVDECNIFEVNNNNYSNYRIVCFNYKVIIIHESQIFKYFEIIKKNFASNFYFTSKNLENEIFVCFKPLEANNIKFNGKQINDCSNLIKKSANELIKGFDLKIKKPNINKLNEIRAFWSIINRDISFFLVLNSLKNSRIDRFLYYSDFFGEESNKKDIEFNEDEFINLATIGSGSVATTSLVYHISSEKIYVKKEFFDDDSTQNFQEIEKVNYTNIHHPLFPRYYGSMKCFDHPCLLLEYIDGTTLNDIDKSQLSINDKLKIIFQIMIILEYLHFNDYIYRDLKPDNIIINSNKTAFLLDFNKMIKTPNEKEVTFSIASNFVAPEILNEHYYTNKVDIFSLGLVIEYILSKDIHVLNISRIINRCKSINPDARPTISELVKLFYNDYFSKITPVPVDISIKFSKEEQYFTYLFLISEYSNPEAQYQLGLLYYNGVYLPNDLNKAIQFYDQSAKSNHAKSLYRLGMLYYNDERFFGDKIKGFNYLLQAANLQDPDAQLNVGLAYMPHFSSGKCDYKKGFEYLMKASEQNNLDAFYYLGFYSLFLSPNNLNKAIYYLKIAADQNSAMSQHQLGIIYSNNAFTKVDIKKALHYFTLASNQGFEPSQYCIGLIYLEGDYVERNMEKAIYYFKLSADNNFVYAQWILSGIYFDGKYIEKDIKLSIHYLEQAAKNGFPEAQCNLGLCYLCGKYVQADIEKALYYLNLAANKYQLNEFFLKSANGALAQRVLGKIYLEGKLIKKNINKAIHYLTLAANNDDDEAQFILGDMFSKGKCVFPDMKKAIHYLTLSANQNNLFAMCALGDILYNVKGVEYNVEKALNYLTRAANLNHLVAQYNLGKIYLYGKRVPQDINKAIYYFSLSADQNFAESQACLGLIYSEGIYIQPDKGKALHYLMLAANQNCPTANSQLGYIYFDGKLVPHDIDKAIHYFTLAANHSVSFAQFFLGFIYSHIKPDEEKSIYYFTKAANQSHEESQKCLGLRYLLDDKIKDIKKAIFYLKCAAEQNNVMSNFILGVIYLEGRYVSRDYKKAIYFFKNASSFNDEFSKNNLAIIYYNVMNNVPFAIELLKEAIRQKNDRLSMYNLAHIYFYNEKLKVSIDNIIELLINSSSCSFSPSLVLLSLALIKKFPHHNTDEIKSELVKYGIKSKKINSILFVINESKLNDKKCYNNVFEITKNDVYVYYMTYIEVPFEKIISVDFEELQETKKSNMKDINEGFYEGFYNNY